MAAGFLLGGPEAAGADGLIEGGDGTINGLEDVARVCGVGLSFTPTTKVATKQGEQAIGTLKVGEQVWAYNPKTKKMELQPILHVWINHDNDLVDLTVTKATQGKGAKPTSEVLHTNKKHPFLTVEKGFVQVGQIKLGMHVVEADGQVGVISGWKVVPGVKVMYNLEVQQDHTYTVGVGQWIVHNSDCGQLLQQSKDLLETNMLDTKSVAAVATTNVEDSAGIQIVGTNGGSSVSNIGSRIASAVINNGKCAETECAARIVDALNNGGRTLDEGIIKIAETHKAGIGPCIDCMINSATLSEETQLPVFLRWSEGLYIFD